MTLQRHTIHHTALRTAPPHYTMLHQLALCCWSATLHSVTLHAYTHTHTHIQPCMHACMHTSTYIHIYTHIHTCMHTYIQTYMHTYIHGPEKTCSRREQSLASFAASLARRDVYSCSGPCCPAKEMPAFLIDVVLRQGPQHYSVLASACTETSSTLAS